MFQFIRNSDVNEVILGILSDLIWVSTGILIFWVRRNLYFYLITKRKIITFFSKRKYLLIWNDHDIALSKRITQHLQTKGIDNYRIKHLRKPEDILYYPPSPKYVHAIIIIVTDVTKLSENEKIRIKIQTRLNKYVSAGGTLFGTHDLIYKRCRNEELQEMYGCQVKYFQRSINPIQVNTSPEYKSHPILTNLPHNFSLSDGEIITGEWANDIQKILLTSEKYFDPLINVPILCIRHSFYKGLLIWISCADKSDAVAASISMPQPEFIQILYNALTLTREIKNYSPELPVLQEQIETDNSKEQEIAQ